MTEPRRIPTPRSDWVARRFKRGDDVWGIAFAWLRGRGVNQPSPEWADEFRMASSAVEDALRRAMTRNRRKR